MFHHIPDAKAITRANNGVFRQVDLYRYKDRIFIKQSGGFAWILKAGSQIVTSMPSVNIDELELPFKETYNRLGYLVHPEFYNEKSKS